MRPSCTMSINGHQVQFYSPTVQLNITTEDFLTMLDMYEIITNNYYKSDFCASDETGKYVVGCLKNQIKEE